MARLSLAGDEKGQIVIILALVVSILLAGLSLVYTQNILAGTESGVTQLSFPKDAIRDLRELALEKLKEYATLSPESFLYYAKQIDRQVQQLYASHGSYASIEVIDVKTSADGTITSYTVKIVFSNTEVEYEDTQTVVV
ncbi:hypothetical protein [Archaeoglobus veneficus]|uniref:Uncharacterized protein n=1 Tax=Archaeoglobus veneficus (strain DSM 11195 / SNP6) TaxID=693661 RepID=F2KN49_ARCVS|nr:hypothetical protein [Archaeoglobus veneficus]AEA46150.1 hypothetical protein Arcve_0109 [Archaeoglobus veneficus SNP6]